MIVYQGTLIVAGEFTTIGGISATGIAKWNGATWSPLGTGLSAEIVYANGFELLPAQ